MYRPVSRALLRSAARPSSFAPARTVRGRRFISTDPPHLKSRGWKNGALRWGLAAAGIYYYNTSPVFAEQPQNNLLNPNVDAFEDTDSPTIEALTASSRRKSEKNVSALQSAVETTSAVDATTDLPAPGTSPAELEEEAHSQGAFNPVTGEINWDCPCLGGMAYGPCGPEFKEAFSCFVYSTEEPKGMDCIDKFQNMQTCFRAHPEHYQDELADDEEIDAELAQEKEQLVQQIAERKAADEAAGKSADDNASEEPAAAPKKKKSAKKSSEGKKEKKPSSPPSTPASSEPQPGFSEDHEAINEGQSSSIRSQHHVKPVEAASVVEDELVPKASHDARSS